MKVDKYRILSELIETNKRQFVVPVYQRNYDWKREHCKKLFDDIVAAHANERFHFLGTIIYVDQGEENKIRRNLIIDGQQRITTIFLLLKALHDASDSENLKAEINALIFNKDNYNDLNLTEQNKVKLKPIKMDNAQFTLLMQGDLESMDKSSNVWRNYDALKSWIRQSNASREDILSGLKKLTAAVIVLDPKEDNPQVVFESINSTGLELSLADLIRNFILMTDKDQERLFEQYWLRIEDNVQPKDMPDFITDYLQFSCRERVTAKNAYDAFKSLFSTGNYSNEDMLKELLRYSGYYKAYLYGSGNYSAFVNKKLAELRSIDQSTIYPFLFRVFDDYRDKAISQETLENVLAFFVSYLLRRIVCGVSSNSLKGLFKTLYRRVFEKVDGNGGSSDSDYRDSIVQFFAGLNTKDAIPPDEMFKAALLNGDLYQNKKACRYVLQAIENSAEDGSEAKESVDFSGLSIEHIMPQNLTEEWKTELGENYEEVHKKHLHKLGNLSVTGYNSELGNKPFAEKKQKIRSCNSHIVVLNRDVLDKEVWNEEAITARTESLSGILLKIFKIEKPKKGFNLAGKSERSQSISIGDDFDFTGTKPSSFIFMGESFPVDSHADLLSKMMQLFYEWDSEIIESLAARNFSFRKKESGRPNLTTDPGNSKTVEQIKDTDIFYEKKLSANDIAAFLRALMDECQIDSEELIICLESA